MMNIIKPSRIIYEWGWFLPAIAPAFIAHKPDPMTLLGELIDGRRTAWNVSGEFEGVMVTSVGTTKDTQRPAMWVDYVAGVMKPAVHRRVQVIRDMIAILEQSATSAKCEEMRLEGRDWMGPLRSLGYRRVNINGVWITRKRLF
jgi:hypothetical protein